MAVIKDFLAKKWAKWVIIGVAALLLFIILPLRVVLPILFTAGPIAIGIFMFFKTKNKGISTAVDNYVQYDAFCNTLDNSRTNNLILSGGTPIDRFLTIAHILQKASAKRIPVIVLHSGFEPFRMFSHDAYYDPCVGKAADEVAEIFTDAAGALGIDTVVHSSIKYIVDVLHVTKGDFTLADVVKFPCDSVIEYLDDAVNDGSLNDTQYDKLKQRYNNPTIKDNILRATPLFSKLKPLLPKGTSGTPLNFRQAVESNGIIFFDLLNDANVILKELVFADINKLTETNKFWVVAEGISFVDKNDSSVNTAFLKSRGNITLIYSGEDVPQLTMNNAQTFQTLVGGDSKMLLFAHTSQSSAQMFSGYFGQENKTKITKGTSTQKGWIIHKGSGTQTTVQAEKDDKFPPQHFMKLAASRDINNNETFWGLDDGECVFVKDNAAMDLPEMGQDKRLPSFYMRRSNDDLGRTLGSSMTGKMAAKMTMKWREQIYTQMEAFLSEKREVIQDSSTGYYQVIVSGGTVGHNQVPVLNSAPQAIPASAPVANSKFCNNCGTQLASDLAFCISCGTKQ